jgi:O-antigen/teichoic acid export membrane protein
MAVSIISILKNSVKFTFVKAISAFIGLPVTIYVATVLVPEEYGIYGLLSLWLIYATLIGPGAINAASREIPVLLGRDQKEEALKVQNISISSELTWMIIPTVVIIGASFFYADTVLKTGLIIIAISYIAHRLAGIWIRMNFVREKFNTVAGGNLIITLVSPVVILLSVHWLKVYALLVGPLVAHVIALVYYFTKGAINFRFTFDKREIIRMVKVGIIFQGLGLIFWAFRIADRTIIASTLSLEELGLYTFAIGFLMYALALFTDFGWVLQPVLWREAGTADSVFEGFKDTKRIAVYLALGTAVIIPIAQLVFYLVVTLITKKYIDSITIFHVLSYNLYLASIGIIPRLILNSSMVNKPKIPLYFFAVGLALNIGLDLWVIRLGYGVIGVAWVTIGTQGLVTFILYYFIKDYVFKAATEFSKFLILIIVPFLACIPFYFIHIYLYSSTTNMWVFTGMSLAAQLVIWSLIIGIFYRDYLSLKEFRAIRNEINAVLSRNRG